MKLLGRDEDGNVLVLFAWSDNHGPCAECGAPAAYEVRDNYGPGRHMLACCGCAALAASDGQTIRFLNSEDEGEESNDE